ncbi:unnamed protein product [Caenorhabditis brenneri]
MRSKFSTLLFFFLFTLVLADSGGQDGCSGDSGGCQEPTEPSTELTPTRSEDLTTAPPIQSTLFSFSRAEAS